MAKKENRKNYFLAKINAMIFKNKIPIKKKVRKHSVDLYMYKDGFNQIFGDFYPKIFFTVVQKKKKKKKGTKNTFLAISQKYNLNQKSDDSNRFL